MGPDKEQQQRAPSLHDSESESEVDSSAWATPAETPTQHRTPVASAVHLPIAAANDDNDPTPRKPEAQRPNDEVLTEQKKSQQPEHTKQSEPAEQLRPTEQPETAVQPEPAKEQNSTVLPEPTKRPEPVQQPDSAQQPGSTKQLEPVQQPEQDQSLAVGQQTIEKDDEAKKDESPAENRPVSMIAAAAAAAGAVVAKGAELVGVSKPAEDQKTAEEKVTHTEPAQTPNSEKAFEEKALEAGVLGDDRTSTNSKETSDSQAKKLDDDSSTDSKFLEDKEVAATTPLAQVSQEQIQQNSAAGDRKNSDKVAVATDEKRGSGSEKKAQSVEKKEDETEQAEEQEAEDESKYPSGFSLNILTFGLFLATFVIALDNTIIATAIPRITSDFNSLNDVGWYGSSYLLTTTSLQPTFGKIYTYFSVKWTYLFALFIFEVGSIICAVAPNSTTLIVGRAVAGVGASALFSGGMTIIGFAVPLRKRALYIAILSSTFGIASVVGPLLGGVFTDSHRLTWRFCFWINLPFGGAAILTTLIFFKSPPRKHTDMTFKEKVRQMDLLGAFFLISAIVCLLLALQWGGTTYPWKDSKVWGCLLGFGLLISVFISLQLWYGEEATIPPRIISQRSVASGCAFTTFFSMGLYAHVYYLPFYFQAIKGTTAEGSGIRTIPYLVSITLASIVVGASVTTFGYYTPFLWIGGIIYTVGSAMLYTLKVHDGPGKWIGYQILAGWGAGAAVQVPFISVQVVLNSKDMPTGNALTIFFNSLGGSLSISIAQNIFSNTLSRKLNEISPELVKLVVGAGATNVQKVTPPKYLPMVLEAYDTAVTSAYILPIAVGGIAFLASLAMEMKSVKGKKLEVGGGA